MKAIALWPRGWLFFGFMMVSLPATTYAATETPTRQSEISTVPKPEITVSPELADDVRSKIVSAKYLSAFGIGIWGVASLLQISGFITIATLSDAVNGHDEYVDGDKLVRGIWYLSVGYLLNVLAPIPGVIADKRARRAIARVNGGGLKVSRRQIAIGSLYGVGLQIAALGVGAVIMNEEWWALGLVVASNIVFDVATIGAYRRVRGLEKAPALMPIVGRGTIGLGLSATF